MKKTPWQLLLLALVLVASLGYYIGQSSQQLLKLEPNPKPLPKLQLGLALEIKNDLQLDLQRIHTRILHRPLNEDFLKTLLDWFGVEGADISSDFQKEIGIHLNPAVLTSLKCLKKAHRSFNHQNTEGIECKETAQNYPQILAFYLLEWAQIFYGEALYLDARSTLEQALELDPKNVEINLYLARSLKKLGFLNKSQGILQWMEKQNPNEISIHRELLELYFESHQFKMAWFQYRWLEQNQGLTDHLRTFQKVIQSHIDQGNILFLE